MSQAFSPSEIEFSAEDLALFGAASLDFNPLHLDAVYARTTSYGQQVVFGVAGAIRCLGQLEIPAGQTITGLTLEFQAPILIHTRARTVRRETVPGKLQVELVEGSRTLVKVSVRLGPGEFPALAAQRAQGAAVAPRQVADDLQRSDLCAGDRRSGRYQVAAEAFSRLVERVGLGHLPVALSRVTALLWSSYLVGMELPGRRALFNALNIEFEPGGATEAPLEFEATVKAFDPRFGLLRTPFVLNSDGRPLARGEIRAFVREAPGMVSDDPSAWLAEPDAMAGKVAWVVGGSRGLGARIARALAGQGATVVVSYLRSSAEADALVRAVGVDGPGRIVLTQADASNAEACQALIQRVLAEHGRLDVLVCNACPPILPMWVDEVTASRVGGYVAESLDLVVQPLAAALPALAKSQGTAVAMSSVYAAKPPANFPHYVAAKRAIEGVVAAVAAREQGVGFMLVRPPRLEGELNMPMKGELVLSSGQVAGVLARHLARSPVGGGQVELLDDFGPAGTL